MIRVPAAARHTRADAKGVVGYARRRRCALVASSSSEPRPGEPGKYLNRGSTTTCGRRSGLVRSRYVLPLGVVMKRTLFGHHITHHQVATIPLRGGTSLASDSRCTPTPDPAPDGQRPIVIGVCGTDRSRWAVEHAARAVGDTAPLYLVSAVRPASPVSYQRSGRGSAEERRLRDALRDEGYLLTDLAVIHEVQRHARGSRMLRELGLFTDWCAAVHRRSCSRAKHETSALQPWSSAAGRSRHSWPEGSAPLVICPSLLSRTASTPVF